MQPHKSYVYVFLPLLPCRCAGVTIQMLTDVNKRATSCQLIYGNKVNGEFIRTMTRYVQAMHDTSSSAAAVGHPNVSNRMMLPSISEIFHRATPFRICHSEAVRRGQNGVRKIVLQTLHTHRVMVLPVVLMLVCLSLLQLHLISTN